MADTKQKTAAIKPSKRALEPKKKKHQAGNGQPTKEEYAVAKFVRFKCPTKQTTFGHRLNGEEVHYFVGSKAVDILMESKWSSTSKKQLKPGQQLFTSRQSCVDYMQQLLMKGLFFRAKKLVPKVKEKTPAEATGKKKDQGKKEELSKSPKATKEETELKRRKKDKGDKNDEDKDKDDADRQKEKEDENGGEKDKEKSSKAKKVKLDWHNEQLFIDGPSAYVWKYDPTPLKTWLLGLAIVLGAIGICLFPLWPIQLRAGIYYVSCGALVFLGAFFGFIVLRTVLFGIIWAVTLGRHHLWLFPNLTEDCGFFESFKPYYSYKYVQPGSKANDDKEKKKSKKSDSEDEDALESKDQAEDRGSESESDNGNVEPRDQEDESVTASQDDLDDDASSNEQSARTSADEEPNVPKKATSKKSRPRHDVRQESNNGDFEFVENPGD